MRKSFASELATVRLTLSYLGDQPASVCPTDDAAIIVAGSSDVVGPSAAAIRSAGVPVMVCATQPARVELIAAAANAPIPEGDLVVPSDPERTIAKNVCKVVSRVVPKQAADMTKGLSGMMHAAQITEEEAMADPMPLDDEGLRRSKESYHPVRLLEKYLVQIPAQPEKGDKSMQEVYEFLKKCGTYYLATVDGDQPRVRPFGTVNLFEGKLYIQTGKVKAVSKEMAANPKVELCAFDGETWLRVSATAVEDDRVAARQDMLDHYPELQSMYAADDGNTQVLALTDATATFSSFAAAPRTVRW